MLDTTQKDLAWTLFDAVDLGVAVLDCDRRVVAWNAWLASASAISREAAIGARFEDLFPEGSVNHVSLAVTASLESGTSRLLSQSLHPTLLPLKTRSGQDMIHDATVRAVDHPPNRYCLVQVFDVSVAVKRERLLRERQNARYDAVVDSAPDVILTLDDEDIIQFANPAADRQFGYAAKELIGQPAALLFEDRAAWNETRRAVLNGDVVRQPVEVMARRKDGSASYLEVSLSRWESQSRVLITAILRDVNERRVAQEILRASEAQFRTLAQAMPNHVWTARPDGQLDWFNERVYEYSGVKSGTLERRWVEHPCSSRRYVGRRRALAARRSRLARRMKRNFGSEARRLISLASRSCVSHARGLWRHIALGRQQHRYRGPKGRGADAGRRQRDP